MIKKHSTSKFATKLKFKIYKPNKNSQFFLCVSTNTDTNKLNWRFNHIFLVITNRNFYCMLLHELHWLPLSYIIRIKLLVLIFKCLHGDAPSYLSDLISFKLISTFGLHSNKMPYLLQEERSRLVTGGDRSFVIAVPSDYCQRWTPLNRS